MDRRGFIGSILAACAAPAIVRADSLMRIVPRDTGLLDADGWDWNNSRLFIHNGGHNTAEEAVTQVFTDAIIYGSGRILVGNEIIRVTNFGNGMVVTRGSA